MRHLCLGVGTFPRNLLPLRVSLPQQWDQVQLSGGGQSRRTALGSLRTKYPRLPECGPSSNCQVSQHQLPPCGIREARSSLTSTVPWAKGKKGLYPRTQIWAKLDVGQTGKVAARWLSPGQASSMCAQQGCLGGPLRTWFWPGPWTPAPLCWGLLDAL